MDAETFSKAMGGSLPMARYRKLLPAFNKALVQAQATTVKRAAMFVAQLGHESAGLRYMEEIASGEAYEGRRDLGNTQPGDGRRFKGHGPIQITGRHNHTKVSEWAHQEGYTTSRDHFVRHPDELGSDRYGFLGAVWYWTVARNMNRYADAADLVGATKAVNGGTNGLEDRRRRYEAALKLGTKLLPSNGGKADSGKPTKPPAKPSKPSGDAVLRRGSTGSAVRRLQAFLNTAFPSYSELAVDGAFGPATERVVREFQKRAIVRVDGVVGSATWAKLRAFGYR